MKTQDSIAAGTAQTSQGGAIPELQSFRGLAALVVLVHHSTFYYQYDRGLRVLSEIFLNAHAAVVSFYVLSGYVLTLSLMKDPISLNSVRLFFVRRLFRIYPALWVACSLGLVYIVAFHGRPMSPLVSDWWGRGFRQDPISPAAVIASFGGMGRALPIPIWSIFVELCGSALLPFIVFALLRSRLLFGAIFVALLAIAFIWGERTRMMAGVYLVDFVLGASITLWVKPLSRLLRSDFAALALACLALAQLVLVRRIGGWTFESAYHAPLPAFLEALGATMLITTIMARRSAFSFLRRPVPVWLGDISYSLYLFHLPILGMIAAFAGEIFAVPLFTGNPIVATTALLISTLSASLILANYSYRWVELKGIRLGKQLLSVRRASPTLGPKLSPERVE